MGLTTTIQNWDQAVLTSGTNVLSSIGSFLPSLIGAIVILVIGFIAANIVGALIARILVSLRFNVLADHLEVTRVIKNSGVKSPASEIIGQIGYWFVLIIALLAASDTLGLHQVSVILGNILLYIPNVVVAIIILMIGALFGDLLSNVVRGTVKTASITTSETLAHITRWAVVVFAVLLAMEQLGIAPMLIEILFTGIVAALAIAFGLSFGLGGQKWSAEVLEYLSKQVKGLKTTPVQEAPRANTVRRRNRK